jgi:hypothetical protein
MIYKIYTQNWVSHLVYIITNLLFRAPYFPFLHVPKPCNHIFSLCLNLFHLLARKPNLEPKLYLFKQILS